MYGSIEIIGREHVVTIAGTETRFANQDDARTFYLKVIRSGTKSYRAAAD